MVDKKKIRKQFDRSPGTYEHEAFRRSLGLRYLDDLEKTLIFKGLSRTAQTVILEVGMGPGRLAKEVSYLGGDVTYLGIDFSQEMTRMAKRTVSLKDFHPIIADAGQIPIKNSAVDVVICVRVLTYLPEVGKVLEEIHRILKPDGRLILQVPNQRSIIQLVRYYTSMRQNKETYRLFTFKHMERILVEKGFHVCEVDRYAYFTYPFLSRVNTNKGVQIVRKLEHIVASFPAPIAEFVAKFILFRCIIRH